jgi:DNA-binding GntR family transcriptional regulator
MKIQRSSGAKSKIPGSYDAYNNEFHALILRLGGNRELPGVLDQTRLPIFRLQFNKTLLYPDQITQSRADHALIVDAILKVDPRAAELAMRTHIRHSAECIMRSPANHFA